ncbi:HupE/UreJ family protein [Microvirga lotononidis]|uniref:Hydrogenase/urease accessory protein n=1 Tax=Microvirga lotononidis TaxID=864069 RepID=I4Z4F3_9HYPH|nr:HupE/UreJ family protein [Microvirga lotononidis]EIM31095.1 hydrogenase/urease accessory protein [Microvirga lotononidis]WQO30504.1 HupE/UreJ family protein [Microvirga lotononidis]
MKRYALAALVLATLSSSEAWAHTGHGTATSITSGFAHPFSGFDHVLAMAAIGLWAGSLGRRAILGLPASFLGAMALGFCAALMGSEVPMIELGITASVLGLGLAVLLNLQPSIVLAAGACGIFGIFHGYAHGTEIAPAMSAVDYGVGFLSASALLLGCGLGLQSAVRRVPAMSRIFGGGVALAGVALFFV